MTFFLPPNKPRAYRRSWLNISGWVHVHIQVSAIKHSLQPACFSYLDRHQTPTSTTRTSTYYHYYSITKHTEHTSNRCTKYKAKEDKANSQSQQTHRIIMSSSVLECWRLARMYMVLLRSLANRLHHILNSLFKEGLRQSNQLSCLLAWVLPIIVTWVFLVK